MIRSSSLTTPPAAQEADGPVPAGGKDRRSNEGESAVSFRRERSRRLRRCLLIGLGGLVLGVSLFVVAWVLHASSNRIPELTRADFDAAWDRWQETQPEDYLIVTTVVGMQPATYEVQVTAGAVEAANRNGNALKDRRTLGTWSVPGMFRTIEHDLLAWEAANEFQHGAWTGTSSDAGTSTDANGMAMQGSQLHLRAEFDPDWGFPRRYLRVEWGTGAQVSWTVEQFQQELAAESGKIVSDEAPVEGAGSEAAGE